MQHESPALLWEARRAAELVRDFVAGRTKDEYDADVMLRSAVERQFAIVGEALNRLRRVDLETAESIPDLAGIIGFRNVLIHRYASVDNDIVWSLATTRSASLVASISQLLEEAGPPPDGGDV